MINWSVMFKVIALISYWTGLMGQQVASEPDLMLEVNDFTLIFHSFLEMIWLTICGKVIPLFVDTKSISRLSDLSLTLFL